MTNNFLMSELHQFTGTENWYQHWLGFTYTDGVKYLAQQAGAYWLIDAIGSYQKASIKEITIQFWRLTVNEDKSAVLQMREDSDRPSRVSQKIAYTDFPLKEIELYFSNNVLLLPSEY